MARNLITYGSVLNPVDVETQATQLHTVPALISNVLKYAGYNAGFPNLESWNQLVNLLIIKINVKLGIDIQDPRTTGGGYFMVKAPSTGEDTTTSPFHSLLILLAFLAAGVLFLVKKENFLPFLYGLLIAAGFILFSFLYRWQVFSVRYETVFFVLSSPLVGLILGLFERLKLSLFIVAGLFVTSLPWMLNIDSRPLIPTQKNPDVKSILLTPREILYFGSLGGEDSAVKQITSVIEAQQCTRIGIMLRGEDPEYWFWALLGAPRPGLQIEWIISGSPSAKYRIPNYAPCAVICDTCTVEQKQIRGLNLYSKFGQYELFMNPTN